ncbi:hypothetical protein [Absidia glauca]|uniref:PX domain-containing protein n=1 Tax=Absidia glauca TaxID=4829 RepID=A0A163JMZ8_ABSGL|nr:hypothetical protein [Absidia glauca]
MDSEPFICSASVLSYERRGRETWYTILIVPRQEPCYTIHRRYQDFVRMSNQLMDAFPRYNSPKKHYPSCFPCTLAETKVSPPPPPPPPSAGRSFKDHYNHHYHRAISTYSPLPRLSSSILLTPSTSSPAGFPSASNPSCTDHRFLQLIANRKRRLKQLDRYLYELFRMPLEVHQSPFVFEFLNYQPFFPLPLPTLKKAPSPAHPSSCPLFPCRYSKSLPPTPTPSLAPSDDIETPPIQEPTSPSSSPLSSYPSTTSSSSSIPCDKDNAPLHLSLYLGPGSFVSTTCARKNLTLEIVRRQLNKSLEEQGLEPLPPSSVLAYNHIASSDRQGALETLTLNQKDPWMEEYDQVMTLALSHRIAFFASTLPPGRKWKYNKKMSGENKGKVLLVSCENDLQAALHGKWRRLDHVTLSCLAW